jgi:hypothetical protein
VAALETLRPTAERPVDMARNRSMNYGEITKQGFLLGLVLFGIGVGGEVLGRGLFGGLPDWEATLLLFLEGGGILLCLFVPLVFGIFLPLTE